MTDQANNRNGDDAGDKTTVISGEQETLNKELAKAKEQDACLIIIRGTPQGHRFFLTAMEMTIGRDPTADITLSDPSVSRKHAKIIKKDGKVYLKDNESQNGTFVNDVRVPKGQETRLEKEDMIKLGSSILKYLPAGELEILFLGNLENAAYTDALTKTYNKGYLTQALEAEFKRARALHTDLALIMFDIDHFKKVNDTYGHDAGDFILKEFADLIRKNFLNPKDIFARYGGEEFVLVLGNSAIQEAMDRAEKIRASIESNAFVYEGKRIPITGSMGVAELRADVPTPIALLRVADQALYVAKNSGRNRVSQGN